MIFPTYFVDEQLKGNFKTFKHQHFFKQKENYVEVIDILEYETPFGVFGKLFDTLLLKKHLTNFIIHRNSVLKNLAENQTCQVY